MAERILGKQSVRLARRHEGRHEEREGERRGDGLGGTKNGTTAIKQSSRVMYGGPRGDPTRDLRRAKPLLSRLS